MIKGTLRWAFLLANIVAALLLIVSTLTTWIAPSVSIWPSLLSYACPYLFLLNIAFVIGWLCFSRKEFLLSLIVILLRCGFIPQYVRFGGEAECQDSEAIKVMTFNVHGFKGRYDTLSTDSGARQFVELVRSENPDILSLEEFFEPNRYKLIDTLESMGYRNHHGAHRRLGGIVIFSKLPFDYIHSVQQAGKIYVDIRYGKEIIRFVCVHLGSYALTSDDATEFTDLRYNDTSARNLASKIKATTLSHEREWKADLLPELKQSPYPTVILGDFNDTPASYIYQQMSKHLTDAFVKQGHGLTTTYHGPFPAYRIDHLFCDSSLTVVSYKSIRTDISDHYPVIVGLKKSAE